MKKVLYLMRHGETRVNKLHKIQGASDSPLTETGIQQAKDAKNYFARHNIVFDYGYASTQERASDTLEVVTNAPYQRLKGLKEMDFGDFEAQATYLQPKGPDAFENFYVSFGGESALTVRQRMLRTLTDIAQNDHHQQILVVSHNGACFYFLQQIWQESFGKQPLELPHCAIIKLIFDGQEFQVVKIIDPTK